MTESEFVQMVYDWGHLPSGFRKKYPEFSERREQERAKGASPFEASMYALMRIAEQIIENTSSPAEVRHG